MVAKTATKGAKEAVGKNKGKREVKKAAYPLKKAVKKSKKK